MTNSAPTKMSLVQRLQNIVGVMSADVQLSSESRFLISEAANAIEDFEALVEWANRNTGEALSHAERLASQNENLLSALKAIATYPAKREDERSAASLRQFARDALTHYKGEQCGNCNGVGGITIEEWTDPISGNESHSEKCDACDGSGIEPSGSPVITEAWLESNVPESLRISRQTGLAIRGLAQLIERTVRASLAAPTPAQELNTKAIYEAAANMAHLLAGIEDDGLNAQFCDELSKIAAALSATPTAKV